MAVCDKDCFHCIYPDCICDKVESLDAKLLREAHPEENRRRSNADRNTLTPEERKAREKQQRHEYYITHKDLYRESTRKRREDPITGPIIKQQQRAYYQAHKELHKSRCREWQQKHPEQVRQYAKKWRETHPEEAKKQAAESWKRWKAKKQEAQKDGTV